MGVINLIESWYNSNCDGEWEHVWGIKITTLDNPGWCVEIDLSDTKLEGKHFNDIYNIIDDNDWIDCRVEDNIFIGGGDSFKLGDILSIFINWANEY